MAGKKSAKGGDPEAVSAPKETADAGGENLTEETSAAEENPTEEVSAAADPQEMETSVKETAEESEAKEAPAEEAAAAPGAELQGQEAVSNEASEASGSPDIFADRAVLEESFPEEETQTRQEDPAARQRKVWKEESQEEKSQEDVRVTAQENKLFRITCRNAVSEVIGGVRFVEGVGYTRNAYAASWFANKSGYRVDREE